MAKRKVMDISNIIKCGNSKRKVSDLILSLSISETSTRNLYSITFAVDGYHRFSRTIEEYGLFHAIKFGYAGLRQTLRSLNEAEPKLKFYEEYEGDLMEQTIDDIFWTQDCVTDEMEEMMEWAKENGYEPE